MGRMAGKGPSEGEGGKEMCRTLVVLMMVWIVARSYVAGRRIQIRHLEMGLVF